MTTEGIFISHMAVTLIRSRKAAPADARDSPGLLW